MKKHPTKQQNGKNSRAQAKRDPQQNAQKTELVGENQENYQ